MIVEAITGKKSSQTFSDARDDICKDDDPAFCCGPRTYNIVDNGGLGNVAIDAKTKTITSSSTSKADVETGTFQIKVSVGLQNYAVKEVV